MQWNRDEEDKRTKSLEEWHAHRIPETLGDYPAINSVQPHRTGKWVENDNIDGINPWLVERCPNPIIFKYLWEDPPGECSPRSAAYTAGSEIGERPVGKQNDPRGGTRVSVDGVPTAFAATQPHTALIPNDSTLSFETFGSSALGEVASSRLLIAHGFEMDVITPATSMSSLSVIDKSKSDTSGPFGALDLINFTAVLPEQSLREVPPPRRPEVDLYEPHFEGASTQLPNKGEVTPAAVTSDEGTLSSVRPPSIPDGNAFTKAQYPCPDCDLHFATPGRRRYVSAVNF
jgi:hypothetical protein